MRIDSILRRSAQRFPEKTALVVGDQRITYTVLDDMASQLAEGLVERGVAAGDRVIVFADNSLEAVVGILGALRANAVFSPVNPTTKSDKLAYILNNCRARAVITQNRLYAMAAEAIRQAPSVALTIVAGEGGENELGCDAIPLSHAMAKPAGAATPRGIDIDLAMVIYTSGSTGFPKGVMMTHQNIEAAATSITRYLQNTSDDVILNVLPLSFDYGLYQLFMSCLMGATLILEKSFAYPFAVLEKLTEEQATGFPLVPTMAAMLLQMKDCRPEQFSSLRYISNTGAALPPAHIERLRELFPSTKIFSMYGLTECKRCTYLPPDELAKRPDSVGIAIPNTEAYVVRDDGTRADPGEIGELVIRGPHVMKGYWEDESSTNRALRPGKYPWEKVLHTGDLFRSDDEGFLYFVGRTDDIIKTRGEKVSPKEVENVLYSLPGVREAAVIGIPDPILGTAVKAVIVPVENGTLSERDVQRHCSQHLESFMVPKCVEFRSELPKTSTGKIRVKE